MLGSLILYHKGMRIMMFQLSGFYYRQTDCPWIRERCGGAPDFILCLSKRSWAERIPAVEDWSRASSERT